MAEQTDPGKFSEWVNKLARNKAFAETLRAEMSEGEMKLFTTYIEEEIIRHMQSVNAIYMSNPAWKYGTDFTIEELENLKKARAVIGNPE